MARVTEISQIYDRKLKALRDPQKWEETLRRTSNFWRLSFCEAMLLTEQNPNATVCGTLQQWNKCGRYVRRGEKSVAVFKDRTDTQLTYLFDVTQTYGAAFNPKWVMSERIADGIVGKFNAENDEKVNSLEEFLVKALDKKIDLVYNYDSKLITAIQNDPRILPLITESARCICMTRCGIDREYDFSVTKKLSSDLSVIIMGNAATALAGEVLRDVDRTIRRKEYEQYEAAVCGRHLRYPIRGKGRTEISELRELRQSADVTDREESVRSDDRNGHGGIGYDQHERTIPDNMGRNSGEIGTEQNSDGGNAEKENDTQRGLRSEGGAAHSDRNAVTERGLGNDTSMRELAVGGDREQGYADGDSEDQPEYDDKLIEEEYDEAESDEDSASFVGSGEQLSFFTDEPSEDTNELFIGEYNRLALLEDEILRGTGFVDGKFRVQEYYLNEAPTNKEFAAFMKKEYGIGGHSGDGDVDFIDHDSKGIRIRVKDVLAPDGISTARFSWSEVAKFTAELIDSGEYITRAEVNSKIERALADEIPAEIEEKVAEIMEKYGDSDKFYVNLESESVTGVYYNPDSSAGGQLVYNRFDFDDIDEALLIDKPADYIYSVANVALVDVTDTEFVGYADAFLGNSEGESDSYIFVSDSPSKIEELKNFIDSAREFDSAIRDRRIIHLEVPQDSDTKSGVPTENARQKAFVNFRLEYSDDGCIAIAADTDTENGLILRSFRDVEPAEIYDFLKKNDYIIAGYDSTDRAESLDTSIGEPAAANSTSAPTITCEWSESSVFEDGKTYSVREFDELMKAADEEFVAGKAAALDKYGSHKEWINSDDKEYSRFLGYDKVKFTVNMPDGTQYTERQDIGDGYGGVIEFLSRYPKYESVIPILKAAAGKEAVVETNGDEWFIADKNDRGIILEPKEYGAKSNEDFLKSVAGNNPDYAEYIHSHLSELSEEIDHIRAFLSQEAEDIEHDRLAADIAAGGYGDDTADSAAEQRLSLLEHRINLREEKSKSVDELQVGDVIKYDGETWRIAKIGGDFSIDLENTDKSSDSQSISIWGNWKINLARDEFEYVSREPIAADKEVTFSSNTESPIEVAIESTDDYSNSDFHSELTDIDVQNADGSYGKSQNYYRIVTSDNGQLEAYGNTIYTSFDEARRAISQNEQLTEISYDDIVKKVFEERNRLRGEHGVRHRAAPAEEVSEATLPKNYRFPENFSYSKGAKAKYEDNIAAIKVLQTVERERRFATPQEQEILARYSGWGGIADAFDESKDNWHREYVELKSLLSQSEYKAARASTRTAFYTDPYIINSIYAGLQHFGFNGGYILDPSMGTGNFFGNMPQEMAENSRLFGVELDSLTSRIAKLLYPAASIQHKGFEQTKFDNGTFDVVVGNVPFGDFKPYDRSYDDEYYIHDYFFIKSLDKLKTGGIAALVTSSGTMDKFDSSARLEMFRRADLIGAVRLPNNAFKTAGTETVTDILFFQKIEPERDVDNIPRSELPDWIKCDGIQIKGNWFNCNTYFANNTENILGDMQMVSGPYGPTNTVVPRENTDIEALLNNTIRSLDAQFSAEPTVDELPDEDISEREKIPYGVRPFTYYVDDGTLYFAEADSATEYKAKDAKERSRIIDMCGIAEQVDKVISLQRNDCTDEQLAEAQGVLNERYDLFVKKYGNINSQINRRAFREDIRAPKLSALEIENKGNGKDITYSKADIFSKRTVNSQHSPDHADNALEAMHISLNLRRRIDLHYMAQLCGKSEDEVISELGDNIYCDPAKNNGDKYSGWETAEEYLSGYTKQKLGLAMVKAEENPDLFSRNVEALKEHQPPFIPINGIGFRLGSMFIPQEMFTQFMWDTFETNSLHRSETLFSKELISAEYVSAMNEWRIPNKTKERSVKVDEMFGTGRINAYELTELTLNQKRAEVKDRVRDENGKDKYILNKKETILAREKQTKIENAFREWVLSDPERIRTIENIYNERFNSITPRKYDGSYINVPGMAQGMDLYPHQKNAIARYAAGGCGLVAHEVGAGKTSFSAALGMYLKSIGAINKPMYVVPNAVIGQFGEEFLRFFPEANILVATEKDFEKDNRRRFLSKISAGNYDAIIISHSQFEKVPLSIERQEEMYDKKIDELTNAIAEMKRDKGSRLSVKKLESERQSLEKNIEKLRAAFKKDDFITFEDLGCDYLIVDEAHIFKNLTLFSKMHNVAGVSTDGGSQRAFDLECKSRYLQEINDGGGVILMTGTPISNAISEMFVWQYLLQYPRLKEMGIEYFDNWASVFGKITQSLEVKPSGSGFRMRTRFSEFCNLPELCNLFGEVTDIVKTADLDLNLPQIAGGKPKMIICDKSPAQEEQTEVGLERARLIEEKLVTQKEDNMPAVCTYMTKVALDGRILDPEAEDYDGSKVNECVREILEIGKNNPHTAQVVFCDGNTPNNINFSVYRDIKDKLVASGQYKPEEIAFIHDANNDKQKMEMFAKINDAKIRLIIGSTQKLGTGTNIQQRLIGMHHLDAPFRPSDIEQRNGRGIRQGNSNSMVAINYYATKGTFDTYRWQLLEKKQRTMSQIMSGKPAARTCQDIDEVALTFAEMKAAATDNPLIAEKLTVDNEVERLTLLKNEHIAQQSKLADDIEKNYPEKLEKLQRRYNNAVEDTAAVKNDPLTDNFQIEIGGSTYTERTPAGKAIEARVEEYMKSGDDYRSYKEIIIGKFHGFDIGIRNIGLNIISLLLHGKNTYSTDYAFSGYGATTRIDNMYSGISKQPEAIQKNIDAANANLENAKAMYRKPFESEEELAKLLERQAFLNAQLEFGSASEAETEVVDENASDDEDEDYSPEM